MRTFTDIIAMAATNAQILACLEVKPSTGNDREFTAKAGHDRFIAVNDFFEHLGLIAGLVLVSVLSLHEQGK